MSHWQCVSNWEKFFDLFFEILLIFMIAQEGRIAENFQNVIFQYIFIDCLSLL